MKHKIGTDFFKEYTNITDLQPNGNGLFSFVQHTVDYDNDRYLSNLFLYNMKTNEICDQLTSDGIVGPHQWADEENIIFLISRGDEEKEIQKKEIPFASFYNFNIKTKKYEKLFQLYNDVV